MKRLVLTLLILIHCTAHAAIYDCFTCFNELEVLKIRFEELYDQVDHFVIVEGTTTFTGKPKPLFFKENMADFEKYKDKIIHIVVDEFPPPTEDAVADHWAREELSRNAIMRGLTNCAPDDIIFISDLDEIPNRKAIREIKDYFQRLKNRPKKRGKKKHSNADYVCALHMRLFMFQLNRENTHVEWIGGFKAIPYWFLKAHTPWRIKCYHLEHSKYHIIRDAGWHFSTIGDKEHCLNKWFCVTPLYNHEDFLITLSQNEELLEQEFQRHVDSQTVPVPIDKSFPKHILDNLDYYHSIGWIASY